MRIHAVRFFLIFSFIVAQFFTQQLHDLSHILSNDSEPEITHLHTDHSTLAVTIQEKHEHCKFLQLIANKHTQPFLTLNSVHQLYILTIQNIKPTTIINWISYSDSSYHEARAPPAV